MKKKKNTFFWIRGVHKSVQIRFVLNPLPTTESNRVHKNSIRHESKGNIGLSGFDLLSGGVVYDNKLKTVNLQWHLARSN